MQCLVLFLFAKKKKIKKFIGTGQMGKSPDVCGKTIMTKIYINLMANSRGNFTAIASLSKPICLSQSSVKASLLEDLSRIFQSEFVFSFHREPSTIKLSLKENDRARHIWRSTVRINALEVINSGKWSGHFNFP